LLLFQFYFKLFIIVSIISIYIIIIFYYPLCDYGLMEGESV